MWSTHAVHYTINNDDSNEILKTMNREPCAMCVYDDMEVPSSPRI